MRNLAAVKKDSHWRGMCGSVLGVQAKLEDTFSFHIQGLSRDSLREEFSRKQLTFSEAVLTEGTGRKIVPNPWSRLQRGTEASLTRQIGSSGERQFATPSHTEG